jgi:hypothetical protein
MGTTVCIQHPKRTQTETGPSVGLPQQPHLALVSHNSWGLSNVLVLMEMTHLPEILQVPSCSLAAMATSAVTARSSSSSPQGMEPPPKKAHFGAFLWVSCQYKCGAAYCLRDFYFSYLCS